MKILYIPIELTRVVNISNYALFWAGVYPEQLRRSSLQEPRYTVEPTTASTTRYTVEPCGARYTIEPSSMTTIRRDNGVESEYRFEPVSPTKSMNCYAEIDQVERISMGIGGQCTRI